MSLPPNPFCDALTDPVLAAAYAIGALDGALRASPVRALWLERAAIIGLAQCLDLAGLSLTPAELFRASVGLADAAFVRSLDRGLLSAVVESALPALCPDSSVSKRLQRWASAAGLLIGAPWLDEQRPTHSSRLALAKALAIPRADVGTALSNLASRLPDVVTLTWSHRAPHVAWPGWLAAALLPAALNGSGLTATPLPCLTGLSRSMRYRTGTPAALAVMTFNTLAAQASAGLTLLRRLEACSAAWRSRLDGITARSSAGRGAGLFLIWPAMTRAQAAAALALTPAGAGKLLNGLVAREILTVTRFGPRTYYVAEESLGEFKLIPRQGRPRPSPLPTLLSDVDAALAEFDALGVANPVENLDPDDDDAHAWAYQDQP